VVPGNIDTLEIPSGSKAISKAKHFKRKYKAKLEFLEVWGWGTQTNLYRGHGVFVEQHIDCTCTLFTDSCFYLSCGKWKRCHRWAIKGNLQWVQRYLKVPFFFLNCELKKRWMYMCAWHNFWTVMLVKLSFWTPILLLMNCYIFHYSKNMPAGKLHLQTCQRKHQFGSMIFSRTGNFQRF